MVATMQRYGAPPSMEDIVKLIDKAKEAYDDCSDSSGSYKDLRKEVRKLREALRDLRAEFKDPDSEVNRDRSQFSSDLTSLHSETHSTLDSLFDLIDQYFKRKDVNTENLRLRQADLDQIGNIRLKLINCKMFVEAILENIEKQEKRNEGRGHREEQLLVDLTYKMDRIADGLARNGGNSQAYEEDLEETWRVFREKLIAQGVSSDDMSKYGSNLRRHLRKLVEDGRLSQSSDSFRSSRQEPLSINTSQWLDGIYTPPLSIDTINSASTDTSIKELGSREENIKFPQAMKSQRAMPGTGRNETNDNSRVGSWNSNGTADSGYAMAMVRVPEPEITTTDMILREDFAMEKRDPARLLGAPPVHEHGRRPRRFSDDTLLSDSTSQPSPIGSARSSNSFIEHYQPRLAGSGLRPDSRDGSAYGASPRASGSSLFGSSPTPNMSGGMFGHSPRTSFSGLPRRSSFGNGSDNGSDVSRASTLQPDQAGRPIPSNAQWTKVNRKLVSPEVLNGGGYRYEARENYVAILGVLSRSELQELAEATLKVRATRSRRSREHRAPLMDRDNRPTSFGSNDATPTPATFNNPPSGPSAFAGVPAQTQSTAPTPKQPVPLKPILKNANKSVRFDDEDLKGSDLEASDTGTPSYTTDSDTESSSDRRRIDPRDSRRPRSDRDRDRDSRHNRDRERDRERDDRHRSKPMPINQPKDQYLSTPSGGHGSGRRSSWENESRGGSYDRREGKHSTPRASERNREADGRNGERNANWSQKLTAGGIGAAAGTILSVAADVLMEGLI